MSGWRWVGSSSGRGRGRLENPGTQTLEVLVFDDVVDVLAAAGEEVVETDDVVAVREKPLTEVGPYEAGTAGDENAHVGPIRRAIV